MRITGLKHIAPAFPIFFLSAFLLSLSACSDGPPEKVLSEKPSTQQKAAVPTTAKTTKVLYVDSYHAEYAPNPIMHRAARKILEPAGVTMREIYMDAKRKKGDALQQAEALKVKDLIETWQPDLVIAADDAASKYLVMPYYRDAALPFVFMGVNWDAAHYEYPYSNVTGQVEVELIRDLLNEIKKYARGSLIGILTGDTLTDRTAMEHYNEVMGIQFDETWLVNTFDEWKETYLVMQNEVDALFVRNYSGIKDWDDEEAKRIITNYTTIPTGALTSHMAPFVLINFAKDKREFGEYAAHTALKILNGTSPADIPLTSNQEARIFLNMPLAKKLDITFPIQLINIAHFTE